MSEANDSGLVQELRETIKELKGDMAQFKDQIKLIEAERDELKATVTSSEQEKMSEVEKLKAQLEELKGADKTAKEYEKKLKAYDERANADYEAELAKVPDETRERLAKLTAAGDPVDRLATLREMVSLATPVAPPSQGTHTQPAGVPTTTAPATEGAKVTPAATKEPPTNWSSAFPDITAKLAKSQPSVFATQE